MTKFDTGDPFSECAGYIGAILGFDHLCMHKHEENIARNRRYLLD